MRNLGNSGVVGQDCHLPDILFHATKGLSSDVYLEGNLKMKWKTSSSHDAYQKLTLLFVDTFISYAIIYKFHWHIKLAFMVSYIDFYILQSQFPLWFASESFHSDLSAFRQRSKRPRKAVYRTAAVRPPPTAHQVLSDSRNLAALKSQLQRDLSLWGRECQRPKQAQHPQVSQSRSRSRLA